MAELKDELMSLFEQVEWQGDNGYYFHGVLRSGQQAAQLSSEVLRGQAPPLFAQLASDIYWHSYCRADSPDPGKKDWPSEKPSACTVEEHHPMRVELPLGNGSVIAVADGLRTYCPQGTYLAPAAFARSLRPGDRIAYMVLPDQSDAQLGFRRTELGLAVRRARPGALLRFYLPIAEERTAEEFERLVAMARSHHLSCLIKAARGPYHRGRRDAVVLYCDRNHGWIARDLLVRFVEKATGTIARAPPLFSHVLSSGIGFAEDPVSGKSFGMERSEMIAATIIAEADATPETKLHRLVERFAHAGLDFAYPHRNALRHDRRQGPEAWD